MPFHLLLGSYWPVFLTPSCQRDSIGYLTSKELEPSQKVCLGVVHIYHDLIQAEYLDAIFSLNCLENAMMKLIVASRQKMIRGILVVV